MTLVDTNVLLDVLSNDPRWSEWSFRQLARRAAIGPVIFNEIVYAEMSARLESQAEVEQALEGFDIRFERAPLRALFVAGKSYSRYRASGGIRTGVLPDFFIAAHAQVLGCSLLTRDVRRYRTYFPDVPLITPEEA
ncbi:MAG: type II toxin-antitoxin system VapC family toxin [Xanthobacteraceae bacterium]|jgi:predicted nucleic acid-binding protein